MSESSKIILYIDTYDWREFQLLSKDYTQKYDCIFIESETFLRGRVPGLIKRLGRFEERWNYVGITEMIHRASIRWHDFFEEIKLKEELSSSGLTEEDLEYGI